MLLNYHIGRIVLVSLCVGDLVRLGLSSIRVAGFSLQHGYVLLNVWLNEKAEGLGYLGKTHKLQYYNL